MWISVPLPSPYVLAAQLTHVMYMSYFVYIEWYPTVYWLAYVARFIYTYNIYVLLTLWSTYCSTKNIILHFYLWCYPVTYPWESTSSVSYIMWHLSKENLFHPSPPKKWKWQLNVHMEEHSKESLIIIVIGLCKKLLNDNGKHILKCLLILWFVRWENI